MATKPSQVIDILKRYIPARENLMLVGDPGVGKSELIRQACEAVGYDLVISIPGLEDPTEPGGFPWIAEDRSHAVKVLFGQAHKVVMSTVPTNWHWEDFGHGANATQSSYMQWAQARGVDRYTLPDHVSITAATNRRGPGMGVQGVLEPVLGRFHIIEVEPDLDDWCDWFIKNKLKQYPKGMKVVSFLKFMPTLLNQPKSKVGDMIAWPSPRSNFALCRLVELDLPKELRFHSYSGAVGAGEATDYLTFERLYDQMPSLDEIIKHPDTIDIPQETGTLCAVAVGLANKANPGNFGQIVKFAQRLQAAMKGEWGVLTIRDSIRRNERVTCTEAYIKMTSSPLGKLFKGEAA